MSTETTYYRCQNCNKVIKDQKDLKPIRDLDQRVTSGEIVPAGECGECGALVQEYDEDVAIDRFHRDRVEYEWVGTVFMRVDVEDYLGRELTDEEWARVRDDRSWNRGMQDRMCELGFNIIGDILSFLKIKGPNDE